MLTKQQRFPKISVITPSFNQGKYIEDAIQSVLDQGYPDVEHIIIDNCSTDETPGVLAKYPHLVVVSEPDKGQSDALNKGFGKATGDVIAWLNADDYYLEGTFQKIIDAMDDQTDVVYGEVSFVDAKKQFIRTVKTHRPVKWLSLLYCYIPSATIFFRRIVLDRGIRIDVDMHISMDKELFAHMFHAGFRFKFLPVPLTAFRWHDSNKSIDTPKTKRIRHEEGLVILGRYSVFKIPVNRFTVGFYMLTGNVIVGNLVRLARKFLIKKA